MARPEEKSRAMLNRYLREQREESSNTRRPHLASLCNDLPSAGRWRAQVERDIRLRVSEIHNASLSESRVRELNDVINRLLRERRHWDRRVVALGGRSVPQPRTISDGDGIDHGGYLYFGAARDLPEVRDMLRRAERLNAIEETTESSDVLYARLNASYYNPQYDDMEEMRKAEQRALDRVAKVWQEKGLGGDGFKWDDAFRKYIGVKPKVDETIRRAAEKKEETEKEMERQQRTTALQLLGEGEVNQVR